LLQLLQTPERAYSSTNSQRTQSQYYLTLWKVLFRVSSNLFRPTNGVFQPRVLLLSSVFELHPDMLNRVRVRGVWWPFHHPYSNQPWYLVLYVLEHCPVETGRSGASFACRSTARTHRSRSLQYTPLLNGLTTMRTKMPIKSTQKHPQTIDFAPSSSKF